MKNKECDACEQRDKRTREIKEIMERTLNAVMATILALGGLATVGILGYLTFGPAPLLLNRELTGGLMIWAAVVSMYLSHLYFKVFETTGEEKQ